MLFSSSPAGREAPGPVASALAEQGIPCNMIAGHHHDHVFVPAAVAERAVEVLWQLARGTAE